MQLFILLKILFLLFTLHVLGSHKPIVRGISSCFLCTAIWFMWCLCCSSACACGLVCRGGFTVLVKPPRQISPQAHADEQHKHHMNQMAVHKKQLEIPLMMGLWEPETCRVKKEINTQNKQLHPLVTLLQYDFNSEAAEYSPAFQYSSVFYTFRSQYL